MSADANRSAENLVLLCIKHAAEVDLPENASSYTADLLLGWKQQQVESFDAAVGGWLLSTEEAAEAVERSASSSIVLAAQTITLGGTGGSAPGASGGGGAAVGGGAIGGPGGPVGQIDLDGTPGSAPGAGGGGGGVTGSVDAVGPESSSVEATVGRGFSTGVDGQDGGDSMFGDHLRVAGGSGGLSGTGDRQSTDRLGVSTLLLANYVETRGDGLATVVNGGWATYTVLNTPSHVTFPVFILFEAAGVDAGEYSADVEVRAPDGGVRARVSFPITVEQQGDVLRIARICTVETEVDSVGRWTIAVNASGRELSAVDLLITRA